MKSFLMSMCIVVCGATSVYAVDEIVPVDPVEPVVEASSGSDSMATGAVVLFALIGMVIISGNGGFASRDANNLMTIGEDEADNNAGF